MSAHESEAKLLSRVRLWKFAEPGTLERTFCHPGALNATLGTKICSKEMLRLESANLAGRSQEEQQVFHWNEAMTHTWLL